MCRQRVVNKPIKSNGVQCQQMVTTKEEKIMFLPWTCTCCCAGSEHCKKARNYWFHKILLQFNR